MARMGRPPLMSIEDREARILELKISLAKQYNKLQAKLKSINARHARELAEEKRQAKLEYRIAKWDEEQEIKRLRSTKIALKHYYDKKEGENNDN